MKAGVIGIGSALPEHIVTNADFESYLDTTDAWIVRRTGIRERRHLNGNRTLTELAVEACNAALADAGRDAAEVDHVIVSTLTPDRLMPGLAPGLADAIGANGAGAVDLNAACSGFLYALDQAAALVESGRGQVIVVCGAEALSRITDRNDRGTAILFADGAAAVVVAGGHVGVLADTLHLFNVAASLRSPVIAWSAGAMALTDRIVLFNDRAPQGPDHPEIYGSGLSLLRNLVALPHASARLLLGDTPRMAVFARRFAPARCVLLEPGTRIDIDGDGDRLPGARVLAADGHVTTLEAA